MGKTIQTIAAVVVTYNRLNLLKQCIQAIREQSRLPDEIIVVNNDSTDGTTAWLKAQKDLTVINQPNLGGAGGFHTGIKTAYEKGYDWVWCMDDDCVADSNALESLLKYAQSDTVYNSIVVSSIDYTKLSFGLYEMMNKNYYQTVSDVIKFEVIESGNFFNGTLFPRSVISTVGLPLKKLFIKGDEYEYYLRIIDRGFKVYTIINSIVYHPPEKKRITKNIFYYHEFTFLDSIKRYYYIKNLLYIVKNYKVLRYKFFIKTFILDLFYIIVYQKKINILFQHVKGTVEGLLNVFR